MKPNLSVALCVLACSVLVVSGCTNREAGHAAPDSSTSPAAPTTMPVSTTTAPAVGHPLDASALVAQPCSSLTSADVSGLGLVNATGQTGTGPFGRTGCTWAGDAGGIVNINWETADRHGLSDLYAMSSTIAYWQPTTVAGYPAAYGDSISDIRSQGNCVLSTAVSNQLYFFAQIDNPLDPSRSCARAATAAADVINNLRGS